MNVNNDEKINIYGAIGYTIVKNENHKIILFSDMHDKLKSCDNKINMDKWLKSKFTSSIILLEEVPRDDSDLELIWSDSEHTVSLQNLYLDNIDLIKAFDIRFLLIPFSWDVEQSLTESKILQSKPKVLIEQSKQSLGSTIKEAHSTSLIEQSLTESKILQSKPKVLIEQRANIARSTIKTCTLKEYVQLLASFYKLRNIYVMKHCKLYNVDKLINTILGQHYLINKNKFIKFIKKNINLLNNNINDINKYILNEYDDLLNDCMEWYCCALIQENNNKPIIIHTGLYHSDRITKCLKKYYNYNVIIKHGITDIENIKEHSHEGCIILSKNMDLIF